MAYLNKHQDDVLRQINERDVKFVRLWFCDVLGRLKSVAIDPAELEHAFLEGIGFDGSSIEGFTRVYESDMLLYPDPMTFQILPWRSQDGAVARLFCDVHLPDESPSPSDPRYVLEKQLDKAKEMGFTFQVHPEIEFYLLKQRSSHDQPLEPVDYAGYFDHVPRGGTNNFRRRAVEHLERMGISVEFSHHEGGPGQNEIDLRATQALIGADNIMSFRTVVQEIALQEGMLATFMPKPFEDAPGSGMHTHMSLWEGDKNAFYDPSGPYQLSRTGQQFIAGLLHYAKEISAVTNQHVNSYKRLWGGGEAPPYICWGHNNSSALIRLPLFKKNKPQATRVEYRGLDSAANPYLAFAVMLAAGLKGIEDGLHLPDETEENAWELSREERSALGIQSLPGSLSEAVQYMRSSELMAETLGEQVFDFVLANKEREWRRYRHQVTPMEITSLLTLY